MHNSSSDPFFHAVRHRSLSILFGVGVSAFSLLTGMSQAVFASTENPNQELPSVEDLVVLFKRDRPPLGSRTRHCAISPGMVGDRDEVWSDRPLFLWKGQANQLMVEDFYSDEMLWSQEVPHIESTVMAMEYDGPVLQANQLYRWQLLQDDAVVSRGIFSVMGGDRRAQLEGNISLLQQSLATEQASETQVALKMAEFFGNQGLWSDAFAVLYALDSDNISSGGQMAIETMAEHLCGDMVTTQGAGG
ncbi:MAG: hypothetical protein AAGD25_24915 [Cyanobacteria bacterium P01_F01_bin.150]